MKGMLQGCEPMRNFCASELSAMLKAVGTAASRSVWVAKALATDSSDGEMPCGLYKPEGISWDSPMVTSVLLQTAVHGVSSAFFVKDFQTLASVNPRVGLRMAISQQCPLLRPCHLRLHGMSRSTAPVLFRSHYCSRLSLPYMDHRSRLHRSVMCSACQKEVCGF